MSTRAIIGIRNANRTITATYCHFDGYREGVGAKLKKHYTEREKIEKMISLGDMSCLGEFIEPDPSKPHTFDNRQDNVCLYYGRDRGDKRTNPTNHKNSIEFKNYGVDTGAEYAYLYSNGKWTSYTLPW